MSLHVLTIIDRMAPRGTTDWYFDNHALFLRARKAAQDLHLFVADRTYFVSDLDEFTAGLRDNYKEQQAG